MDRDRMTCAGGTAALDMMHALISKQHGADFARKVSDWFLHTDIRPSEGPQRSAIELMENHIADPLELDQLARIVGVSARQLNRLFAEKLNVSTVRFYRSLRLEKARELLQQTTLNLAEISSATGFANSAHFSRRFSVQYEPTINVSTTGFKVN